MKLWNKTVIAKKISNQNSKNFHTKNQKENGLFQDRIFSDVHIFIYKGFPFIKFLTTRKPNCSFSEYHLLFVEKSKEILLKTQDKHFVLTHIGRKMTGRERGNFVNTVRKQGTKVTSSEVEKTSIKFKPHFSA